jgi:iron complex transport system substrate-binding protein
MSIKERRGAAFRRALFVLILCVLIPVYPAAQAAPSVFGKDASRISFVSLGPTITEKLYLLGVEDRLTGVTTYCTRPPAACTKEKVGSVTEVSIEKVIDLRPDVIFATSLMEARAVRSFRRIGMTVAVFREPASFAEMNEQFIDLGRMVGKEERAREIVRLAEHKVARIRERVSGLAAPKVFIQIGSKPLFTATRHSFLNDMVEFAGAANIAADAKSGLYSREQVLVRNPDVILITGMGIVPQAEKKVWQRFSALDAVRNNRIFMLDAYTTCSPTPETFVEALYDVAAAVHPGLEGRE